MRTGSGLGLSATCYLDVWQTIDTLEFLDRCHHFGAAGIQAVINCDPVELRTKAEKFEMYVEAMVPLPDQTDTSQFEASLKTAQAAGATALRAACLNSRRYETFQTLEAWKQHVAASQRSLEIALPLLDRCKIPLGLENHKDWTADEMLTILNRYSSEYFGVCLDFGNNVSLLEPPMETISKLAPYAVATHVKDMAVAFYKQGILMSEVVLGAGCIDLQQAIGLIRKARPSTRMTLEMITRAPLEVPLLTPDYWLTFPERTAVEFDHIWQFVKQHQSDLAAGKLSSDSNLNIAGSIRRWTELALPLA